MVRKKKRRRRAPKKEAPRPPATDDSRLWARTPRDQDLDPELATEGEVAGEEDSGRISLSDLLEDMDL